MTRGIILAGGRGTRMGIVSRSINKHYNLIYRYPMVMYPLYNLKECGIEDIMIVTSEMSAAQFMQILGDGSEFGVNLYYAYQNNPLGIADALRQCRRYAGSDPIIVILGDNFLYPSPIENILFWHRNGGKVLMQPTNTPERFGVLDTGFPYMYKSGICKWGEYTGMNPNSWRWDNEGTIDDMINSSRELDLVEKPTEYIGNLMLMGLYMYDSQVWDIIDNLKPSPRGEYEITDVNREYLRRNELDLELYEGQWIDCGDPDMLLDASNYVRDNNIDILEVLHN